MSQICNQQIFPVLSTSASKSEQLPTLRLIKIFNKHIWTKRSEQLLFESERKRSWSTFDVRIINHKMVKGHVLSTCHPLVWKKPKIRKVTDPCFKKAVRASTPWFEIFWELERWHKPLNSKKRLQNQKTWNKPFDISIQDRKSPMHVNCKWTDRICPMNHTSRHCFCWRLLEFDQWSVLFLMNRTCVTVTQKIVRYVQYDIPIFVDHTSGHCTTEDCQNMRGNYTYK